MLNVKKIVNPQKKVETHRGDSEHRSKFISEIIKVLSNKSREDKREISEMKKRIIETLDLSSAEFENLEDFDKFRDKIARLVTNDSEADKVVSTLNLFTWFKLVWLWDIEGAKEYIGDFEENEENFLPTVKRFSRYADSFTNYFEKAWTEYMHTFKKIPNYRHLLKKVFRSYVWRYINLYLRSMEFSEEECREWFWEIQENLSEKWLVLEASDNIKQSFIKLCREKYPLAKKSYDHLFDNKKFKQDFINLITKDLDQELDDTFEDIVKTCIKDVEKDTTVPAEYKDTLLQVNIVINLISAVNWLIDNGTWDDNAIGSYFQCIANQFEYDHLKKLERNSASKDTHIPTRKFSDADTFMSWETKSWWEKTLSEEENDLIREAVSYIDYDKKRSIIKYITKLKMKDLPIKFYDFKRLFNLKEIHPITESILIDKLWMDYEVEEEVLKVEEEILREESNINKTENEYYIQEEIIIGNPTQYLMDKLQSLWYIIGNKLTLKKQIEEFNKNEIYRTVLINMMTNPRFWKVLLHKPWHKTARVLNIWRTWWRLLFEKQKDGNFHLICFGNHNYYEDRLAKLK